MYRLKSSLKLVLKRGWSLILVTVISIVSTQMNWPIYATAPTVVVILIVGMTMEVKRARSQELEESADALKELMIDFQERFGMPSSNLTIFRSIEGLRSLNLAHPADVGRLIGLADACSIIENILSTWLAGFIERFKRDTGAWKSSDCLSRYFHEFWSIYGYYHGFVGKFLEKAREAIPKFYEGPSASQVHIPQDIEDGYNTSFVKEYNDFVRNLRDYCDKHKKVFKIDIERTRIAMADELRVARRS